MDDFSVLFLDYPSYLQVYQKIRRFKDPLLLETTLIKKRRSNETFMLKEENALSEDKFHEHIMTLKQLVPLNKSRIFTKLVKYSYTKDSKSGLYTLFLIYEFYEYNLEKEILFRMKNNQRFEENRLPWMPIVICTAYGSNYEGLSERYDSGIVEVVNKPLKIETLGQVIEKWM